MRRILRLTFCLTLVSLVWVSMFSCEDKKGLTYDITEESREALLVDGDPRSPKCVVSVSMPFLPTGEDNAQRSIAKKINNLVLKEFFNGEGNPHEVVKNFVDDYLKEYKEDRYDYYVSERSNCLPEDTSFLVNAFSAHLTMRGSISSGRNGMLGFTVEQEVYNGGAHPVSTTYFVNFNPVTGDEVKLSDVFLTGTLDQLTEKITRAIAAQNKVRDMEGLRELGYDVIGTPQEYLMGPDSLTFFYNVYEIGPYALGPTRVSIAYKDMEDIMVK